MGGTEGGVAGRMRVTVRLFAALRDAAGTDLWELRLQPPASGEQVRHALTQRCVGLAPLLPYCRLAVNCAYASWETPLHDGDDVGVLPPVSGG